MITTSEMARVLQFNLIARFGSCWVSCPAPRWEPASIKKTGWAVMAASSAGFTGLATSSFLGLAAMNSFFYFTALSTPADPTTTLGLHEPFSSVRFTMPLCCVVMAHFPKAHYVFAVPVAVCLYSVLDKESFKHYRRHHENWVYCHERSACAERGAMKLGLTLPGFVERSKVIASLPSPSLLTLRPDATKVRGEYREILDLKTAGALPEDYDLVAITSLSAQIFEAYAIADFYRGKGVPVVMGGLHVTSLPDEAREHCTSVVVGEGEPSWPEVLDDFEHGRLKPFYVQSPRGQYDLREAPLPRFDLLDPEKYNRITVQTSRGCPHKCEFCASSILLTPRYKVKPVDKVIAEIQAIKRIWPKPFIEFADDNSFVHREHYKALLRELAREDLRWFTEADLSVAQDEELLGLMRDSGCQQVLIGLESPRRSSISGVETNSNWKARQLDRYREAIAKIQAHGITVNGCFILGLDGDTPEVFDEVLGFVRDSGLYEVQVTFLTAFPGTPLYARLKAEGRIIRDRAWDLCTLFDINIKPRDMSVAELQSGYLQLVKTLYSAQETTSRRRGFRTRLKKSLAASRAMEAEGVAA